MLLEGRAYSRRFVRPCVHMSVGMSVCPPVCLHFLVRDIPKNLEEVSSRNFVGLQICSRKSAVYENYNSIPLSCLILNLVSFLLYTLNFVRDTILQLQDITTRNVEGRYISLSRSSMYKNRNSALHK